MRLSTLMTLRWLSQASRKVSALSKFLLCLKGGENWYHHVQRTNGGALLVADAQRLLALVDVALEDFLRILIICVDEAYVPVVGRERSSIGRCTR